MKYWWGKELKNWISVKSLHQIFGIFCNIKYVMCESSVTFRMVIINCLKSIGRCKSNNIKVHHSRRSETSNRYVRYATGNFLLIEPNRDPKPKTKSVTIYIHTKHIRNNSNRLLLINSPDYNQQYCATYAELKDISKEQRPQNACAPDVRGE